MELHILPLGWGGVGEKELEYVYIDIKVTLATIYDARVCNSRHMLSNNGLCLHRRGGWGEDSARSAREAQLNSDV